ncbi:hypothetical protein BCR44DRAFT_46097, partial [Catenaria anguillulae PL171]
MKHLRPFLPVTDNDPRVSNFIAQEIYPFCPKHYRDQDQLWDSLVHKLVCSAHDPAKPTHVSLVSHLWRLNSDKSKTSSFDIDIDFVTLTLTLTLKSIHIDFDDHKPHGTPEHFPAVALYMSQPKLYLRHIHLLSATCTSCSSSYSGKSAVGKSNGGLFQPIYEWQEHPSTKVFR